MNKVAPAKAKTLKNIELHTFAIEAIIKYGTYVIGNRALPDFRDGLKSVQRRNLWAMYDNNFHSNGPTVKSARVVGDVIGRFHPHGEGSIYEALVNLAKEAQPLIVPQGNFGFFNTKHAAQRYTECKLHKYSEKILLNSNYIPIASYMKNYDGNFNEPMVLPALLPNLLVNGAEGIAVGVTVGIPPFKIDGVIKITKKALKKPIKVKDCVKYLKINYPDPFDPEVLTSDEDVRDYFKTGQGTLKLGVGYEISGDKMSITRFPPHFKMEKAILKLNTFEDVASAENHNNKDGKKLVVTLKSGIQAHGRTEIFKKLAYALSENFVMRVNVIERIDADYVKFTYCTMPELITKWVKWRIEIEVKRHLHEAEQLSKSIANLELQVLACINLDKIVPIIKSNKPDVDERLAKALKITLDDAKYILSLTLRRLTGLSLEELKAKIKKETAMKKESMHHSKHPADKILADLDGLTKGLI